MTRSALMYRSSHSPDGLTVATRRGQRVLWIQQPRKHNRNMPTDVSNPVKKQKSEQRQRQRILATRVTADESRKIEKAAADRGMSVSMYVRQRALAPV